MAGNAGNWFKPERGKMKGKAVYLSRFQQGTSSRADVLRRLEGNERQLLREADRFRPQGAAKAGGALPPPAPPALGRVDRDLRATRTEEQLFGRVLGDDELRRVFGVPDGARVEVVAAGATGVNYITAHHPLFVEPQFREVYRDQATGALVIANLNLILRDDAPPGTGTRLLAQQVAAAGAAGVQQITTHAAGPPKDPKLVGYTVWPRLGYDGDLPEATRATLPPAYAGATRVSDLMRAPGGADWWRANGQGLDLTFDPRPGSASRRVLDAYMAAKGYTE